MGASKIALCIRGADAVNPSDHEYCNAALYNGTNQRGKALSDKQKSWCNVHVMGQLHVGDKSSAVLICYLSHSEKRYSL